MADASGGLRRGSRPRLGRARENSGEPAGLACKRPEGRSVMASRKPVWAFKSHSKFMRDDLEATVVVVGFRVLGMFLIPFLGHVGFCGKLGAMVKTYRGK